MDYKVRIFSPTNLSYPTNGEIDFEFHFEAQNMIEVVEKGFKIMRENGHYINRPFHASLKGEVINTDYKNIHRYHFHDDGWCDWFIETDMPFKRSEEDMRKEVIERELSNIRVAIEIIEKELYWDKIK